MRFCGNWGDVPDKWRERTVDGLGESEGQRESVDPALALIMWNDRLSVGGFALERVRQSHRHRSQTSRTGRCVGDTMAGECEQR